MTCKEKKYKQSRNNAWREYLQPIKEQAAKAVELIQSAVVNDMDAYNTIAGYWQSNCQSNTEPLRKDVMQVLYHRINATKNFPGHKALEDYYNELKSLNACYYIIHICIMKMQKVH